MVPATLAPQGADSACVDGEVHGACWSPVLEMSFLLLGNLEMLRHGMCDERGGVSQPDFIFSFTCNVHFSPSSSIMSQTEAAWRPRVQPPGTWASFRPSGALSLCLNLLTHWLQNRHPTH